MTRERRNEIIAKNMTSLNATAQAMRRQYGVSRRKLFQLLAIPSTVTSVNRYWKESYNIKKWEDRSPTEMIFAHAAATQIYLIDKYGDMDNARSHIFSDKVIKPCFRH